MGMQVHFLQLPAGLSRSLAHIVSDLHDSPSLHHLHIPNIQVSQQYRRERPRQARCFNRTQIRQSHVSLVAISIDISKVRQL